MKIIFIHRSTPNAFRKIKFAAHNLCKGQMDKFIIGTDTYSLVPNWYRTTGYFQALRKVFATSEILRIMMHCKFEYRFYYISPAINQRWTNTLKDMFVSYSFSSLLRYRTHSRSLPSFPFHSCVYHQLMHLIIFFSRQRPLHQFRFQNNYCIKWWLQSHMLANSSCIHMYIVQMVLTFHLLWSLLLLLLSLLLLFAAMHKYVFVCLTFRDIRCIIVWIVCNCNIFTYEMWYRTVYPIELEHLILFVDSPPPCPSTLSICVIFVSTFSLFQTHESGMSAFYNRMTIA